MTSEATVMSKPVWRGKPLATPPRLTTDVAQRAVVHVHHPAPGDAAGVDVQRVAPVDVVVDHRRQQVVRRGDRVEIAGEVEVHVLHRHDLRLAAAGRAALHAEVRARARPRGCRCRPSCRWRSARRPGPRSSSSCPRPPGVGLIAVTRIRWPFVRSASDLMNSSETLALSWPKGSRCSVGNAELRPDFLDRLLLGVAGDFDVGHGYFPAV